MYQLVIITTLLLPAPVLTDRDDYHDVYRGNTYQVEAECNREAKHFDFAQLLKTEPTFVYYAKAFCVDLDATEITIE